LASTLLVSAGHISTPDGHLRIEQARAWVEDGSLELPADVGNTEHGNIAVTRDGKRYAVYAPGHSIVLVPLLLLARLLEHTSPYDYHYVAAFFASFVGPVALGLSGWLLYHIALQLRATERRALAIAIALVFGTLALPHSTDGYDHTLEMLFVTGSFYLVLVDRMQIASGTRWVAVGAGIAAGTALTVRYNSLLVVPALGLLCRRRAQFLAGFVPFALAAMAYNAARFGSPFDTGYSLAWSLERPIAPIAGHAFSIANIPRGLVGLWLSPGKGMLWYSPILSVAAFGWPEFARSQKGPAIAAGGTIVAYSLLYASNFAWHGSAWCWGPRYLVPVLPFCLLGLLGVSLIGRPAKGAVLVVAILSVVIQLPAIVVDYHRALIERYRENPNALDDDGVFFRWAESPLFAQAREAERIVAPGSRCGGHCEDYIAPGRWRTEARPASLTMMLDHSIDLNVPNLWWLRMQYEPVSSAVRTLTSIVAVVLFAIAVVTGYSLCVNATGR